MSKSLGNFTLAADVLADHDPLVVRYALAAAHYRSSLDLSESSWSEADAALGRIRTFMDRASRTVGGGFGWMAMQSLPAEFITAMDDDLGVPQALAALHEAVRAGNVALDQQDADAVRAALVAVTAMTEALGINPMRTGARGAEASALDALVRTMIDQRAQARADKDWAAADRIRDAIAAAGITLEDSPAGTHWSIDG
jgi:cysteinyl-tRNA synthetase